MKKKEIGKKLLSAALVTTMAAGMLAGCGDQASSNADTQSASTDDKKDDSKDDSASGKTKIVINRESFNIANPDSEEVKAIQDAINDYIGDKINVEIELRDIGSSEYRDKTNLALSNNEINLLWTAFWQETIDCDDLVKNNAVMDITDLVAGSKLYDSMPASVWESTRYDGKDYFVSCYKEGGEGYDLMFRKELVDKYGWDLSSIKELKDLEPILADCKAEGLKYPFLTQHIAMFYRYYLDSFEFFTQNSYLGIDRDKNEVVNPILSDEYKEFCTLMCEWAEKGYINDEDITKTTPDTVTQGQDWGVTWWTDVPNNAEANTRYGQEVEFAPLTKCWAHSTINMSSCFCVTSNSTPEQAQACVDFLSLLYTDQTLADLYTYGIEGTDYDRDADGAVVRKGDKYNHSSWESCSVRSLSLAADEPKDKVDLYEKFNENTTPSASMGFRFDKSPVEAEFASVGNVFEEYGYVLENGGFAADEVEEKIAEYAKALDDAGYQKILEEGQKQFAEWQAKQ